MPSAPFRYITRMGREAIEYLSKREIQKMRDAGRMAAELLSHLEKMVEPGVTTQQINDEAERWTQERGAISAPLNYGGPHNPFPRSICTSVNEVVCHGIPGEQHMLKDGDIINIDVTPKLDGFHGEPKKVSHPYGGSGVQQFPQSQPPPGHQNPPAKNKKNKQGSNPPAQQQQPLYHHDSHDEFFNEGLSGNNNNGGGSNPSTGTFHGPQQHYGSQQAPGDGQSSKSYKQ